jgi:hypothetical protein
LQHQHQPALADITLGAVAVEQPELIHKIRELVEQVEVETAALNLPAMVEMEQPTQDQVAVEQELILHLLAVAQVDRELSL